MLSLQRDTVHHQENHDTCGFCVKTLALSVEKWSAPSYLVSKR